MKQKTMKKLRLLLLIAVGFSINPVFSQTPVINLNIAQANKNVSPMLYGLMTEEINHSYDGGLYAEKMFAAGVSRLTLSSGTSPMFVSRP